MKDLQTEASHASQVSQSSQNLNDQPVPQPQRRKLIAAVGALVGAALGHALSGRESVAAQGDPILTDLPNTVAGTTTIDRSREFQVVEPALRVDTGASVSVEAGSAVGTGVVGFSGIIGDGHVGTATMTYGRAAGSGGVFLSEVGAGMVALGSAADLTGEMVGESGATPAGVVGLARADSMGVIGIATAATGTLTLGSLRQQAPNGIGVVGMQGAAAFCCVASGTVWGLSAGVAGLSYGDSGVRGVAVGPAGIGVSAANSAGGTALRVEGPAEFATAGFGTIAQKVDFHDVQDVRTTATSHVMVMFTTETKKMFVSWVELTPGVGFRLHLSKKTRYETDFTYLILEAAP